MRKRIQDTTREKLPCKVFLGLNTEEQMFLMLTGLLGLTVQAAYRLSFPTKANATSCCSMASKLLSDKRLQDAAWKLAQLHERGLLKFNDKILKTLP